MMGHVWNVITKYSCFVGILLVNICFDTFAQSFETYDDITSTFVKHHTGSQGAIPHYLVAPPITSPKSGYFKIICELHSPQWYSISEVLKPIKMDLCTHIVYGHTFMDFGTLLLDNPPHFTDALKRRLRLGVETLKKTGTKPILMLVFWDSDVGRLVSDPDDMAAFSEHVVGYLIKEGFDGMQLNLGFMRTPLNTDNMEMDHFVLWVKELRTAFRPHGLLLSVASSPYIEVIPILAEHVEWITLTTNILQWERRNRTYYVSPLFYREQNPDHLPNYFVNVNDSIHYWISKGVPRRKLVMTLPSEGRTFTLASTNDTSLNAQEIGDGELGEFNNEPTYIAYFEICYRIRYQKWVVVQDHEETVGSYMYKGNQWVSFDDLTVIQNKSEYIRFMNLGGAEVDMTHDDFKDVCGGGYYPILSTTRQILGPAVNDTAAEKVPLQEIVSRPNNAMINIGINFAYFILTICLIAIFGYSAYRINRRYRWKRNDDQIMMEKKIVFVAKKLVQGEENSIELPFVTLEKKVELCRRREESPRPVPEYQLQIDHFWEISRDCIIMGELLGEGEFGRVVRAEVLDDSQRGSTSVAVKMLKETHSDSDMVDFVSEMEIMKIIGEHINLINLIGCCTQDGPLLVVVEFAPHGNLRDFLRGCRRTSQKIHREEGDHVSDERVLVSIAFQIASGMEYLSSKKLVHRDLAARNILVGHEVTVKIADFGLTREVNSLYYYRKTTEGKLPMRWMAPEALFDQISTFQSDVWSYGVVLWEIFTLGETPYPSISHQDLYNMLKSGHRMENPAGCSDDVYQIMRDCWMYQSKERPTFGELVVKLDSLMAQAISRDVFSMNTEEDTSSDIRK